ncbi:glycoside hydrolase family 23 protein [Butyriboletus roseoflavus]|nr:glycoside hydrolase family 23 protein [Butyriboletus roseoflavus]
MKVAASPLAILLTLAASVAGHASGGRPALMARHARAARPAVSPVSRGHINTYVRRTCKPRPTTSLSVVSFVSLSTAPTSVSAPVETFSHAPVINPTPITSQPTPSSDSGLSAANTGPVGGLVNVVSAGSCGPSGATKQITALSGPNGNIDFLNCGLTSGGWTPPLMYVDDVVSVELSQVAYNPGSAFSACKRFVPLFEKYGQQYSVPAVMLASFAMQESSCIPTTVGGAVATAKTLFLQDFNIHQGAQFFSQTLDNVNGDLLLAIGHYNGWYKGLTYAEATAAARNGNCREQNNLDYLHQFLNGWMQDINAYEHNPPLGKYFNLNNCSN